MDQHSSEIADAVEAVETRCSTIEASLANLSGRLDSYESLIPTAVGPALENSSLRIDKLESIATASSKRFTLLDLSIAKLISRIYLQIPTAVGP